MSEDISNKVFRLHIIANSDSENDQHLKLKIKDEVLKYSESLYKNCSSVREAKIISDEHLKDFKNKARQVIAFYGYDYDVQVYTSREFFPTREYETFTLPSGVYNTLKIIIGEGKGKNWWCVMYPAVCISGCTEDFDEALSKEEEEIITSKKYIVRFKAIEIYERLKNRMIKR